MSILSVQYTVTYNSSSELYTITWANTYSPYSFTSIGAVMYVQPLNAANIDIGANPDSLTTLAWANCTSPTAASGSALITAILALNTTVTFQSLVNLPNLAANSLVQTDSSSNLIASNTVTASAVTFKTVILNATEPLIQFSPGGTGNAINLVTSTTPPVHNQYITLPDCGTTIDTIALLGLAQTFTGNKTFSGNTYCGSRLFVYSASSSSNAALAIQSTTASTSQQGYMEFFTNGADTTTWGFQDVNGTDLAINGTKNSKSNVLYFDGTNARIGINKSNPFYTLDVNGIIRCTSSLITNTTNQIQFGTTTTTTMNYAAPTSTQTINVPDSGVTTSNVVLTDARVPQTINQSGLTFSSQASPMQINWSSAVHNPWFQLNNSTGSQQWLIGSDNSSGTLRFNCSGTGNIAEFTSAGFTILGGGIISRSTSLNSATTLDQTYSGVLTQLLSGSGTAYAITLPTSISNPFHYHFGFTNAVYGTANITIQTSSSALQLVGYLIAAGVIVTLYNNKSIVITAGYIYPGDWIDLKSDGYAWHVTGNFHSTSSNVLTIT